MGHLGPVDRHQLVVLYLRTSGARCLCGGGTMRYQALSPPGFKLCGRPSPGGHYTCCLEADHDELPDSRPDQSSQPIDDAGRPLAAYHVACAGSLGPHAIASWFYGTDTLELSRRAFFKLWRDSPPGQQLADGWNALCREAAKSPALYAVLSASPRMHDLNAAVRKSIDVETKRSALQAALRAAREIRLSPQQGQPASGCTIALALSPSPHTAPRPPATP